MAEKPEKPVPSRPCKQYALWLLGRREWSAKELAARLKFKGYPAQAVDECVEFCQRHGLQSDLRFASSRTRMRAKSHGNRRISQELNQKGVDAETVTQVLSDAGSEFERAAAAASRFAGKPLTRELQAKAWRFLASRGFSGDAVKAALKGLARGATLDEDEFFEEG